MIRRNRRRLLQAAIAGGILGWKSAAAQSPGRTLRVVPRAPAEPLAGDAAVLTAPRRALVIGNSAYAVGSLKNPVNDASAIAAELAKQGFAVTRGMDLERDPMLAAIDAFAAEIARAKAVGLFYFAGHGLQLSWRNYLVPVDARLESPADIRARCVDVHALIEGVAKAANPMNLIILDACRDNPFGPEARTEQKGLSQLDAPPGTLLAYATSPGNIASDGEGANGLYTEHLLKEMRVPETQIEDVFKRVRLGVRRRSQGRQIPWESTSLEQDFWFIPPKDLVREAQEEELEQAFRAELDLWERLAGSKDAAALEEYLRRYPSGHFAELAQLRLDRLLAAQGEKKIEIVSSPRNPYTAGAARSDVAFQIGDSYSYAHLERDTRKELRRSSTTVIEVNDNEVIFDKGMILDRLGNTIQAGGGGRRFTPRQDLPLEYAVGRKWTTRFSVRNRKGMSSRSYFHFRITGRETIAVPAGTFECFVIEGEGYAVNDNNFSIRLGLKRWMCPERVRRPVAAEQFRKVEGRIGPKPTLFRRPKPPAARKGGVINDERIELVAFRQA